MSKRGRLVWILLGGAGSAGQIAGLAWLIAVGLDEVSLLIGSLVYLAATLVVMGAIEYYAVEKGRSGAWGLTSFAGPLGLAVVTLLKPRESEAQPVAGRTPQALDLADRICATALTALMAVGFVWGGWQWLTRNDWPPEPDPRDIPGNERLAFRRLQSIIPAQERYRGTDWDGDGRKTYALFLAHLWQTVDGHAFPLRLDFVPERLGRAMAYSTALDGYLYEDLYVRELPPESGRASEWLEGLYGYDRIEELDHEKVWAMSVRPKRYRVTGILSFLADNTGRIYASDTRNAQVRWYPHDPAAAGWTEILNGDGLARLQEVVRLRMHNEGGAE